MLVVFQLEAYFFTKPAIINITCWIQPEEGHDGFYDGLNGQFFTDKNDFCLYDFHLIEELRPLSRNELFIYFNKLGEIWAEEIERDLLLAFEKYNTVIYLTHVPPFKEASRYNGAPGEPKALPFFSCRQAGEAMVRVMEKFPDKKLRVYCGHTHSEYRLEIGNNIEVNVAKAQYCKPDIFSYIEI